MEDLDDFGDLYANVEAHVNTGIESFHHLYIEGKKNDDNPKGGFHSNSQKKDVEVDSVSEELISHDQVFETKGDDMEVSGGDSKTPGFKADNENLIVEDGSDSEDDLHIVLNEEDCRVITSSRGANVGNGGRAEGSEDEDDDDDLVIVTEANHQSKDRKPIDGLEQSSGGPGAERGNASKGTTQYSQFKYVRPHAAAFTSNSKTNGSAGMVSFSSPMSGRGDWDVNGGNQQMMSCSGLDTSSYNLGILAMPQKGFDFYLPRNRTILDVGMETFEWKPWRLPGVDITDFFNFGLDEESWKCYCKSLEHFRQQTTMLTKIPVYESSRPNQAYEAEFLQKTVASESVSSKVDKRGERISSMLENVYRGSRSFETPKGRAIRVEGGIGERQPSIDVRRPRYRDSDVVIQIPMLDTTDNSSVSNEGESEHVAELLNICENGGLGVEVNRSMQHCESAQEVLVGGHHQKVMESVSKETSEELETVDGVNTENQYKVEKATLEVESAPADQIQCNLSPSYLQSQVGASNAGVTVNMEKAYNHARRPSSSSLTASEHRQSNDSRSDTDKAEPKDRKDNSREQSLIQEEQNYCDRMRPRSTAEVEIPMESDKASYRVNRKGWYDSDRPRRCTKKGRQHSYDFDENDSIKDKCYYRETDISIGYRGRRFAQKLERRNAHTELFHSKSGPHLREEMGPYIIRNWGEREYLDECITARNDEIKHRDYYFREREYSNGGMSAITHKESDLLISENISFHVDRERYLRLRRKNENDHRFGKGSEDDDFELEHRYREELSQEKYGRRILYYDKEEDFIQEKYGRCVPYLSREMERLDSRVRDAQSPRFSLDNSRRSVEIDGKCRRHPYHKPFSSQTYRELHISDGSEWHDSNYPKNHAYDSWRSKERYTDHWRMADLQDKQSNKDREEGYFVFDDKKHHYQSHHRRGIDFDEDSCHTAEMVVYANNDVCDERKRYKWQWTDKEGSFGHQVRDGSYDPEASFLLERSSRHDHHCVKDDSSHGKKYLDDYWLERSGKNITLEKNVDSEASKCISSASDIADGDKHEASVLRCREPVHLNGWEGKYLRRCSKAEVRCGKYDSMAHVDEERMSLRHSDEVCTRREAPTHILKVESNRPHSFSSKVEIIGHCNTEHSTDLNKEKWLDKFPIVQHEDDSVLEEGQLPEEPENKEAFNWPRNRASEKTASSLAVEVSQSESTEENKSQSKDAAGDNKGVGGYDNHRILETMAKMERRRERFKEPIALKKEPDKSLQPQSDIGVKTAEVKHQRPARKRRWGGS